LELVYRKLYHLTGLTFPVIYYFSNKKITLGVLAVITILVGIAEILRFRFPVFNQKIFSYFGCILKKQEKRGISGTTYFLIASLLTTFFFEKAIAITALTFTVFGDAVAAIWGSLFGKIRIKDKSLEGSMACFILCFFIGMILIAINVAINVKLVLFGALAATLMEILPVGIDDNLTMPIFAGLVMELVGFL
jgi:glycerol-3-phosphate acyltransferase PlsY